MPSEVAPVAVFAYKRPDHLSQCLRALEANETASLTDVTIFCDGERGADDARGVRETRAIASLSWGFRSVTIVERSQNLGLSANITEGVSQLLASDETVIVVEDDLVVASSFLNYMNAGLTLYQSDSNVASIHGFVYRTDRELPQSFFLRGADCWGWATWRRAWTVFNPDGLRLYDELRRSNLESLFDFGGSFPYLKMLQDQVEGRNDSWAIRWYASTFLASMFTLYPGKSLVRNIGLEGSGTHQGVHPALVADLGHFDPPLARVPIVDSTEGRRAFGEAFIQRRNWLGRFLDTSRRIVKP